MIIEIAPEEFSKLVLIFLLDKIINEEEMLPNDENLNQLNKLLQNRKSQLLKQYLSFNAKSRNNYRRLKEAFYPEEESTDKFTIVIDPNKIIDEENEIKENSLLEKENEKEEPENKLYSSEIFYYVKDVVKSVIKKIRKKKVRSPRQIIVDNDIEKIVQKELERRCSQIYGKKE